MRKEKRLTQMWRRKKEHGKKEKEKRVTQIDVKKEERKKKEKRKKEEPEEWRTKKEKKRWVKEVGGKVGVHRKLQEFFFWVLPIAAF